MNAQAHSRDVVDQASFGSIPASDAASWGPQLASTTVADVDLAAPPRPHRGARFMRSVIAVGLALGGLIMLAMRVRRRTR